MRRVLVTALASCADSRVRPKARSFLQGLSADELQYIAEFLGACILDSSRRCACSRAQLAQQIADFERRRRARACCSESAPHDQDHKMILLLEYLCSAGLPQPAVRVSAAGSA